MRSIIVKAPAKVNLYLDVINKRPDGYHNIETIFERIDLCDWIKVSVIPKGIELICRPAVSTSNSNNTAYKATKLLRSRYNLKCGFRIEIDKRIPEASGLGGGSSDAASVFLCIRDLLNIKIKRSSLIKLAKEIGADVPFFVSGYKRAFATGIGQRLFPLKQKQSLHFLLVVPDIRISTASTYNMFDSLYAKALPNLPLTKTTHNANMRCHSLQNLAASSVRNILYNKLEEVVLPSYPVLQDIKKALKKAGAEGIIVSGSGSSVYGIFTSRKEAVKAENRLARREDWQLFLARNC